MSLWPVIILLNVNNRELRSLMLNTRSSWQLKLWSLETSKEYVANHNDGFLLQNECGGFELLLNSSS